MIDLPPELNTPAFEAAWQSWEAHRREIRKKLTPTSVGRQVSFLLSLGAPGAIASIEQSIQNGWTGLFEPKGKAAAGIYDGLAKFVGDER